jgi:ABC-type multidrug transport system ATPase subunit
MTSPAPAVRVRELRKTYPGGTRALDGVTADIGAGRITGLVGPNGAGKSTLLHAIVGLVVPDDGHCEVFGRPASDHRAREAIGFLPEEVTYEAGLRLREILLVHAGLAGREGASPEVVLDLVGLDLPRSRRISRCSLGQARRLALACALLGRPRLLILDEPTSGMDLPARDRLFEHLLEFRREGGTVLLSSHVLAELERVCDAFVLLRDGRVARSGDLASIRREGRLRVRITGISGPTVAEIMGAGWALRETAEGIVAESDCNESGVASLALEIERRGGRVEAIERGLGLDDVYRREAEA